MKRVIFATLLALAAAGLASAQSVPALINYQGKLTDASGVALPTGDYALTLRVYSAPTEGTLVWGPQVFDGGMAVGHGAVVPVVQGHFNVMLGPVDVDGDSILTAFSAATRYLEVTVGAGSPILPRQQIVSAPFAVNAHNASNVTGTANVFPSSGNVGIGDTTPSAPLEVAGNVVVSNGAAIGGTTSVATLNVSGAATMSSNLAVSGQLTAGNGVVMNAQKYCVGITGYNWVAPIVVPNTWTRANCSAWAVPAHAESVWRVGCLWSNGTWSESGDNGSPLPSPNCGW